MMIRVVDLATLLLLLPLFGCNADPVSSKTCPLTYVNDVPFTCDRRGYIRKPAVLSSVAAKNLYNCAHACHNNTRCKCFRYDDLAKKCHMYTQSIERMKTIVVKSHLPESTDFDPGSIYDRDCYSNDCNVIDACAAVADCRVVFSEGNGNGYHQDGLSMYKCADGRTARKYNFQYDVSTNKNSSWTACDAIQWCTPNDSDGSFDVHWVIASQEWECITFNDNAQYYTGGRRDQHINRARYNVRNSSIAEGYGYWLSAEYHY